MIKASHPFSQTDQKIIERIIDNEHLALNHMVLPQGEALPEHFANSNVYMIVLRGKLTVVVDGEEHVYPAGSVVEIDYKTKMQPQNRDSEVLEFFVVKAPGPKAMKLQIGVKP